MAKEGRLKKYQQKVKQCRQNNERKFYQQLGGDYAKIYWQLDAKETEGLFPEEQKGWCKGSRGTAEWLYIDKHIINVSKTRPKNLAMVWIDYKKA